MTAVVDRDLAAARPRSSLARRLGTFVAERFPPLAYGPLIAALVACATAGAAAAAGTRPPLGGWLVAVASVIAAGFLQLRILDEIRDAEIDRLGRPERPVPRGLVSVPELRAFAAAVGAAGALVAGTVGLSVLVPYALAIGCIWWLGTRRIGGNGRAHPNLHAALTHSVIAPGLMLCGWLPVAGAAPRPALAAAVLLVWGASLCLELSRKILLPGEERAHVPMYSAELGRQPAVLLAGLTGALACLGASTFAASVGAGLPYVVVPAIGAMLALIGASTLEPGLGTRNVRVAAGATVLIALLWPPIVLLGLG